MEDEAVVQGSRNFMEMLKARWALGFFVCIGLDSQYDKLPECVRYQRSITEAIFEFNRAIVEATKHVACAYKPNVAFYEAYGNEGLEALRLTIAMIHKVAPDVPVILDAKRADIGNTNAGYVTAAFDFLGADAITVHPYLGAEALKPFLEQTDKGIIVLCRTSNPGAGEFQDLLVDGTPLYQIVARRVANDWNINGNCAVVVGATYPEELRIVREIVGDMPILLPGIGAQGGDLEAALKAGGRKLIPNSSRGIIFVSKNVDYAEMAGAEATKLNEAINQCLNQV